MSSNITITRRDQSQLVLRADLADKKTAAALKALKLPVPAPRRREAEGDASVMWFSPDEVLLFVDDAKTAETALRAKLDAVSLVHDVSGARVVFTLTGSHLRDVLAKGSPRDLRAVEIGEVVRTRLGQIAVAFWFLDRETVELVCFRSVGDYVGKWLEVAALADGLPVLG